MSGVNTVLVTLNSSNTVHIPMEYFECYAIIINVLPIIWSKILDETKTYISSFTPPESPISQLSPEQEVIASEMSTPESYPDRPPPHLDS